MKVLLSWLRDFVDVPADAGALADRFAMLGLEVASVDEVGPAPAGPLGTPALPDAVIDIEVTANRPDWLGLVGIAREVSAAYGLPLRLPGSDGVPAALAAEVLPIGERDDLRVELEDAELCPRYGAAVADVAIRPSPAWLAHRLEMAGVRPISNIVDITNYLLIELGQPMHAFDLARLGGAELRIRRARPAEALKTLDGQQRTLDVGMLVIADAARAQAVAGVMGGAASEVGPTTKTIVLESACFESRSVRRTSKKLGLKTEASARFERGTDIETPILGLRRAAALLAATGAGKARGAAIDRYPVARARRTVALRRDRITLLLGQAVPDPDVARILPPLGFALSPAADGWRVDVPTARVDVSREADLIEEVGRHFGYDRLPATFPPTTRAAPPPDPRIPRDQLVRRALTGAGFSEAITFAFIESAAAEGFAGGGDLVPIDNPLSAKFAVLRQSLLPGLLDSVVHNRRHERADVRLFEVGSCFSRAGGETRRVALVQTGSAAGDHWSGTGREVDFFDVRGIVEQLCEALGVAVDIVPTSAPFLEPGQAAAITLAGAGPDDGALGVAGRLSPALVEARGLSRADRIYGAEIDLDRAWFARVGGGRRDESVRPLPRYPSIVRDLSILVDGGLPAAKVRGTIRAVAPDTLERVREFDRYSGQGVPPGRISVSYRLTFRAPDRTLTDADVQRAMEAVIAALVREHGAVQR